VSLSQSRTFVRSFPRALLVLELLASLCQTMMLICCKSLRLVHDSLTAIETNWCWKGTMEQSMSIFLSAPRFANDPYGIRTRVTAVKGRCLNHLTNGPEERRRRDLNPRAAYTTYSLSRGAPSATWVLLHGSTGRIRTCDRSVNSR
jgi:hypothetical protein